MTPSSSRQKQNLIRSPVLWALMLFSLGLSLTLSYFLNIRFDEAFTLNTTSQGVVYAFKQAIKFEQQAPLYFVVLSLWRNIDSSIFFARLFSVLCFPLSVWVSAEAAKRYVSGVNPFIVAAVICVHQQVVWSSLDIRLYSLMVLLSGLLFILFYDGYLVETPKRTSRIFYIIISILSLYTQYYLGFQLVAAAAALIFIRRWRALYHYVCDMLIAGVFFVPMLLIIKSQVSAVSTQTENVISTLGLVKGLYQSVVPLFVSTTWIEPEFLKLWLVRILVVLIAVLFAKKLLRERKKEDIALAVITVVLSGFFLVALVLLGDQGIQPRHLSSLILPLQLLSFSALTVLKNRRMIFGWAALLILLNVGSLYEAYKPLAKPGDFRRVAEYIAANEGPNQPVLVFHADAVLPLAHYYKGQNKLIAIPRENSLDDWNPHNNVLQSEEQILSLIENQPDNPERFWLVDDGWCAQGTLLFNCQILEDVVTKYFEVESTMEFLKPATVRLLHRR